MNNENTPSLSSSSSPERNVTTVVYALQAASFFVGITFFIAPIVNYVYRTSVAGTWLESHFRWQLNTFWYGLAWLGLGLSCLALGLLFVGLVTLTSGVLWIIYRIVQGWNKLSMNQPMRG